VIPLSTGKKRKAASAVLGMLLLVLIGAAVTWYQDSMQRSSISLYNRWKKQYVVFESGETARVTDAQQHASTVSEGIAYGLLFSVYHNDRDTFQKLLNYEEKHENAHGLMNWKITSDGKTAGSGAASDAEEDMAYALCLANSRWHNAEYQKQAERKIDAIRNYLLRSDNTILPGDEWGDTAACNPSYIAPEYYLAFYDFTKDESWINVLNQNMSLLKQAADPETGLLPDWLNFKTANAGLCGYESVRVPIRLFQFTKNKELHLSDVQDQKISAKIQSAYQIAADISVKMDRFAQKQTADHFYALYHLDGSDPQTYQNNTYLASGYAMVRAGGSNGDIWRTLLTKRADENYYGDSMRLWVVSLSDNLDRQ